MSGKLFIDTGAFIARAVATDAQHLVATTLWQELGRGASALYSSEHVFDESLTLLARRVGYPYAADWGDQHLSSRQLKWLPARPADLASALKLMRKYADQEISFTDCVSFVLMRREGIKRAFSFDKHFRYAGFTLLESQEPGQAL